MMNRQRQPRQEDMNIVIVGHVDHGKSTIIGRLLADTGSLPEGKLDQVREKCRRNSKPFEYAFLLDALKDEQAQGITIDAARCFFKTEQRRYIIIDAPGHIEFLKNMVTGASRAEAALLVIDAHEGIQENSKRHGYLLSMLGIKQIAILVNKMDLVDYSQEVYQEIVANYTEFLAQIEITPYAFIPVSGMVGDNIATLSEEMTWYQGKTLLELLDELKNESLPDDQPFRMPVQDVYKFTNDGDRRRIVAGTIETGQISVGDEVVFYPSGKKSRVQSIEAFNADQPMSMGAGSATGFTLDEQIYIRRGEVATRTGELKPQVTTRIKVNLFWLGKRPLTKDKEYLLKIGTAKVAVTLEEIQRVIDASNLQKSSKDQVDRHDVAECILKLDRVIAFDLAEDLALTSRFVMVDEYEIAGGGIIQAALEDKQSWLREKVLLRNYKWEKSMLTQEKRAEKYNQKSALVLVTGQEDVGKKPLAKALEERLFADGKIVYFLGIGNILYGVDADLKAQTNNHKEEHLRRLAEVSHLMLDAGAILIVTAIELTQNDLEIIKTTVDYEKIQTVWIGEEITTDIEYDLHLPHFKSVEEGADRVKKLLQEQGFIFKPW